MKRLFKSMVILAGILPGLTNAESSWLGGNINDITSVRGALLLRLDTGVPDNCQGTPYGWMMVKETDKTLLSVALALWTTGKKGATVYTDGREGGTGYCVITQIDPYD